jgi:hypothetical protein
LWKCEIVDNSQHRQGRFIPIPGLRAHGKIQSPVGFPERLQIEILARPVIKGSVEFRDC